MKFNHYFYYILHLVKSLVEFNCRKKYIQTKHSKMLNSILKIVNKFGRIGHVPNYRWNKADNGKSSG